MEFLEPPGEMQIVSRNRRKSVKLQCLTDERERRLVQVVGRFEKNEGLRNRDSTVLW